VRRQRRQRLVVRSRHGTGEAPAHKDTAKDYCRRIAISCSKKPRAAPVYLHDGLTASPAVAAAGFAAFSLAMTVGRLTGDRIVGQLGPARTLRGSGTLAAAGLGAALLIGTPIAAIAGFGLVGLGIANIIAVLFSSAGLAGGAAAGSALAAVATPGYLGFVAGPPLIGLAAEQTSLRAALGIVCRACALVAVGAGRLSRFV
jgi:hypothetical protein